MAFKVLVVLLCSRIAAGDVPAAVQVDDECASTDEASCALNALQRKATVRTAAGAQQQLAVHKYKGPEGYVSCNPSCFNPDESKSPEGAVAVAGDDDDEATLGTGMYLPHYGANCWAACGGHSGSCPGYCGQGYACCRWGYYTDPAECHYVGFWPVVHQHTCVRPAYVPPPSGQWTAPTGPQQGDLGCGGRGVGGAVMTLYHQTGCAIGPKILAEGFHLGTRGWCGGGIYFATSPQATETKAIGADSSKGFMIEARVRVGRVGQADKQCHYNGREAVGGALFAMGYDTTSFNPGDGTEIIIYCGDQVEAVKRYPYGNCP